MNLSDEELQQIEDFASIALPLADIAVILQVNPEELRAAYSEQSNAVRDRYCAGLLRLKAELHKSIKESAIQGSNPAQQLMQKFLDEIKNTLDE